MAKKTRTELSTLALNTNLPDNTTELITPTTERAQLTDERESVVNYKDDLGGVPNAGKFLTVAIDGESLTMVDEPQGDIQGSGVDGQITYWDGTKTVTSDAMLLIDTTFKKLRIVIPLASSGGGISLNAVSASATSSLTFLNNGVTMAQLYYDNSTGNLRLVSDGDVEINPLGTLSVDSGATFDGSVNALNYRAEATSVGGYLQSWDGTNEVDYGSVKSISGSGNSYDGMIYTSHASSSFGIYTGGNYTTPKLTISSTGAATFSGAIDMGLNSLFTGGGYKMFYRNSSVNITYSGTSNWQVNNNADNVALMTVLDGGNVLIGTATNAGYKLDVNGECRVKGKFFVEQASGGGLRKQVLTGQITAAASGVSKKIAYVGFTHSITVHLYADQSANSGMAAIASFTTVYGNSTGGITQSSTTQGNVSGITVSYENAGSPAYTINVSVTYINSAPIIYYVIEGINNDNNIYSL